MPARWFEDYEVGQVEALGSLVVDEQELVDFARRYDPQPFHTDAETAAAGPFGGLIASGWHTAAMMIGVFATKYLSPVSSLPSPAVDELRWLAPVRPGQKLTVRSTVNEARVSYSRPDRGIVRTHLEMVAESGEVVCSMLLTNFIRRRPTE